MKIRLCDQTASAYYDPDTIAGPLYFVALKVDGVTYSFIPIDPTDAVAMNNMLILLGLSDIVYTWTYSTSRAGTWLFTVTQSNKKYQQVLYGVNPLIETNITDFSAKSNCNWLETAIRGCNDPLAKNYDPLATENDDSCQYTPVTDFEKLQCCIGEKEYEFTMAIKYGLIKPSELEECMDELLLQQRSFETLAAQKQIGRIITPAIVATASSKAEACFDLGLISDSVFISVSASIGNIGTVYNLIDPLDPIFGEGKAPFYATRDEFATALENSINVYAASIAQPNSPTGGWTAVYDSTTQMFCIVAPTEGPAYNGYVLTLAFFQERFYLAAEIDVIPEITTPTLQQGDYDNSEQKALFVEIGGLMIYVDIDPPLIPETVTYFNQNVAQGAAECLIYNNVTGNVLVVLYSGIVKRWIKGVLTNTSVNTNLTAPALNITGYTSIAKGFNPLTFDNFMAILQENGPGSYQNGTHWVYLWNESFVRIASINDNSLEVNDPNLRDILLIQGQDTGTAEYGKSYANAIALFDFSTIEFLHWLTDSTDILDLSTNTYTTNNNITINVTIIPALDYTVNALVRISQTGNPLNYVKGTFVSLIGTVMTLTIVAPGPSPVAGAFGAWTVDLDGGSAWDKVDTAVPYSVTLATPWAAPAPKFNTNDRITLRKNTADDYWIIGNVVSSDYSSGNGVITFTIESFKHSTALGVVNDMIVNTNMAACGKQIKTNPWDGSIWVADAPGTPFNGVHRIDHNTASQGNPTDTATRITYGNPYNITYPFSLCFVSYQKLVAGVLTDFREMWVVGQGQYIHIYNFDLVTGDMIGGYTVIGTPRASDAVIDTGWAGSGIRSIDQNPYNGYVYSGGYGASFHAVIIIDPVSRTVMPGTNIIMTSNGRPYIPFVFNGLSKIAYMVEEQADSTHQVVAAIDYEHTEFNQTSLTANGANGSDFVEDAVVIEESDNCLTVDENVLLTNRLLEDNCCDDC